MSAWLENGSHGKRNAVEINSIPMYWTTCFFFLKLHHTACRILVPQSGTELVPSALGAHSLNPCAIREVPDNLLSSSSYS